MDEGGIVICIGVLAAFAILANGVGAYLNVIDVYLGQTIGWTPLGQMVMGAIVLIAVFLWPVLQKMKMNMGMFVVYLITLLLIVHVIMRYLFQGVLYIAGVG